MRSQNFEFNGKVTPRMGETLPSVAEYFDVSVLGSLNFMCVVAKSTRPTN